MAKQQEVPKKWEGKSFSDWCASDTNDERKINYTLHKGGMCPETFRFTSEDDVDGLTMFRIRESVIAQLSLNNNEWYVELQYL